MKLSAPKFWYRQDSFWFYLFYPISLVYQGVIFLRRYFYRHGLLKSYRSSLPVLIVGNITVGGTGKTPLVLALAQYFLKQGFRPGIISRGYGGLCKQFPYLVAANSDPDIVGDEAILLARNSGCPVVIAPKRVLAVQELEQHHNCDLIISDDGLQHYALERDVEITILDQTRMFGNGCCLPAGPLREPVGRLHSVDFVVVNGCVGSSPFHSMKIVPQKLCNLASGETVDWHSLLGQKIHAVAGIGNPGRFFTQLQELGFEITEHPFPDHYQYRTEDLSFGDSSPIIMTEKDAVKCMEFARDNYWYIAVAAELEDGTMSAIEDAVNKKRPK